MAMLLVDLPEEIIYIIMNNNNITIQDAVNFSSTCKKFRDIIINDNILWQRKFHQRWPHLKNICEKEICKESRDFLELIQTRIKCGKELWDFLSQMSKKHYLYNYDNNYYAKYNMYINEEHVSILFHPDEITHTLNYYFLTDELQSLFKQLESKKNHELTNIYYGKKLLPYLNHYHLRNVWQEYKKRPVKQQLLEEAIIFVAQWYFRENKNISHLRMEIELDNIAQQVLKHLRNKHPTHPIFSVSHKQFLFWKYNNIDQNQYNYNDGKQVLDILCQVFFELNFSEFNCSENTTFLQNIILVNFVLEGDVGYTVSLLVMFQSIARRFGIRCDLICCSHSSYFLSCKYNVTNSNDKEYFHIHIFNKESLMIKNDCPNDEAVECSTENGNIYATVNLIELIIKLSKQIKRIIKSPFDFHLMHRKDRESIYTRSLEFQHLIKPYDMNIIMNLCYNYTQEKRNLISLINALKKIDCSFGKIKATRAKMTLNHVLQMEKEICKYQISLSKNKQELKERTAEMQFSVGMIVKINSLKMTGVIIGWIRYISNANQTGTSLYYIVLGEHEKIYYAHDEEDLVKVIPSGPINNSLIGIYFCEFKETYYVPNEVLAKAYPQDVLYLSNELQS